MIPDFVNVPSILPEQILHCNLFRAFLWYIGGMFALSIVLRIRFYRAIYVIAHHVQYRCPSIVKLIEEHSFHMLRYGLLIWVGAYVAVLIPSFVLNNFVWPKASIEVAALAEISRPLLVAHLAMIGLMLTIDFVLVAQVSVIDADRVIEDLTASESWLAGEFYRLLSYLGSWNPIKRYADAKTQESIVWLNEIFRQSIAAMLVQLGVRLLVVGSLYASHLLIE